MSIFVSNTVKANNPNFSKLIEEIQCKFSSTDVTKVLFLENIYLILVKVKREAW